MLFNLDFIWIADGKVVDLTENVSAPSASNHYQVARIQPKVPVDMVLEVNQGFIKDNKISVNNHISMVK